METRANYIAVGAFVLFVLVAIVFAGLWLTRIELNQEFSNYDIFFDGSVTGLAKGAPVRYNGIQVGRVVEIRLNPQNLSQVRVTIEVDQTTQIKADSVASLEVQGLTGVAFVEITGGSQHAEPLTRKEGQRYPVIASRQSGLQQFVTNAPEVLNRVILLTDKLAALFNDKNQAAISETLENVRRLTEVTANRAGDVDAALGEAAGAMRDLRATLSTANQTILDVRRLVTEGGEGQKALKSIDEASHKLEQLESHLDALVQEERGPLRDFSQNGLNQLSQLLADARTLVAGLTRLVDDIQRDPPRFFFGGDRREGYQPK
ncbi:MAG TPA: MlaD family protein [Stellaceae bacterium]|nr:MlaD family protein [Stellaceae bacterium]